MLIWCIGGMYHNHQFSFGKCRAEIWVCIVWIHEEKIECSIDTRRISRQAYRVSGCETGKIRDRRKNLIGRAYRRAGYELMDVL